MDEKTPFLERLKFLAISSANLDEFFMIRVAGLKQQVMEQVAEWDDKTLMSPYRQWTVSLAKIASFVSLQDRVWHDTMLPKLTELGIGLVTPGQLTPLQETFLSNIFAKRLYPVLRTIDVSTKGPIPRLVNRSLTLAVLLEDAASARLQLVPIPRWLPRYIRIPDANGPCFMLVEDIIERHLSWLFRGKPVASVSLFRITREADLTFRAETDSELLEEVERELARREYGPAVRLEVEQRMPYDVRDRLARVEGLSPRETFTVKAPLDLTFLMNVIDEIDLPAHRFPKFRPITPPELQAPGNMFRAIRARDILLYHPYESFQPVVRFVRQAAQDVDVVAIKQTLYRVGQDSPIVRALTDAAKQGKEVTVLVELRARFDEAKNIEWAKTLERAGCRVIYGLVNMKTHAKMCLVVRRENGELHRYVHLDTGNYNEKTAQTYTDFSLFTANKFVAEDVDYLFDRLSGRVSLPLPNTLSVAPWAMERKILGQIDDVITHSTPDHPGRIIAKMNSLTNKSVIQALYRASCTGVTIDLIVRGICCLRPGVPGVSDNIHVYSIVGRFLEHGRAYYFHNGHTDTLFLSSADWMTRNFEQRVEILFPVNDPSGKNLVLTVMETQLKDTVKRRQLMPDGTYVRVLPHPGTPLMSSQEALRDVIYRITHRTEDESRNEP